MRFEVLKEHTKGARRYSSKGLSVRKSAHRGRRPGRWVRPELVAEVEFTEWTDDNLLRHPSFKGLREDKPASEITASEAPGRNPWQKTTAIKMIRRLILLPAFTSHIPTGSSIRTRGSPRPSSHSSMPTLPAGFCPMSLTARSP
ncbi:MAG: hypothetical protein R3B51_03415 [Thermodesulfobacteriota bacterium]